MEAHPLVTGYLRLGLEFDRLEEGFVDAFTGDPQLRREVQNAPAPQPEELARRAAELRSALSDSGLPAERVEFLVDNSPLPDESVSDVIDSERRVRWLQQALEVLNERELRILRARRLDDEQVTLEFLGDRLGISKERVRQIENRALEKLKRALVEKYPQASGAFV